ncbi:hypothetical protein ACGF1Z_05325 [Streptomyces sp. NPDC048018]|uniref:hypothetical protein n=1 Tax=Streptomyces sp. NPDC048018 TaxID=3365499 RepID=UPI00371B4A61
MTQTSATAEHRRTRRRLVVFLAMTAVLLLPLAAGLWFTAESAVRNRSGSDWQANHATRLMLQRTAMTLVGLPLAGAACGWITASLRGRSARVPTAAGLLIGTIALWALGIADVFATFTSAGGSFLF